MSCLGLHSPRPRKTITRPYFQLHHSQEMKVSPRLDACAVPTEEQRNRAKPQRIGGSTTTSLRVWVVLTRVSSAHQLLFTVHWPLWRPSHRVLGPMVLISSRLENAH
ncbi:uncharacterized protein LOC123508421 [Portunus trituberculatus]|uniref:uncharacterized protein LOC123508421 n=1 Tax=Portunus trituberculatus TaxID=210409 RepID=UPI001E1CB2DE|nr:uncharacterized protein LOC123508421 [Portunus trituberculatus]